MQDTESTYERDVSVLRHPRALVHRFRLPCALLLLLVAIALILPLLNVNRFQHRIVASLSESLGRPIHLDRISLTVLPLPGFTIENLVVGEDPAFGSEPFVRASSVRATLRVSSLWRRRVEFTRISFTDPSINLVKTSDGKWNLESILLQASRIDAAPTAQIRASSAPRFPYIQATGARLNLKLASAGIQEKIPISLTEVEFALWLHSPQEWQLRLEGRPLRTDTSGSETGTVQMEGTLGRAAALNNVPIDLKAAWRNVPLGEASRILLGHDAGLRGSMTLAAAAQGTLGGSAVQSTLHLADVRRADFLPLHSLAIDAECQATESAAFSSLTDIRCSWPPALVPAAKILAMTGSIPDLRRLSSGSFDLGTPGIPAATLLDWLHIASNRISPDVVATGSLTGSLYLRPDAASSTRIGGQLVLSDSSLVVPSVSATPVFSGSLILRPMPSSEATRHTQFTLSPLSLTLGDRDFATLDGRFDASGYTLHLTGTALPAKLRALGTALPHIGDGLSDVLPSSDSPTPVRFDLTSNRTWGAAQLWHATSRPTAASSRNPHP